MVELTDAIRTTLLQALTVFQGDNLERCKLAFRGCTPEQMQQPYGASGLTRQQLLDSYQQGRNEIEAARAWVMELAP